MTKVKVAGAGITKFGKHENVSLKTLLMDACLDAIKEAGFPKLDAVYIGNFMAGSLGNQEILGAIVANDLGLGPIPTEKSRGSMRVGRNRFSSSLPDDPKRRI